MAKKQTTTDASTTDAATTPPLVFCNIVNRADKTDDKRWVVYDLPGGGRIWITRSRLQDPPPERLTLHGIELRTATVARAKMTDEEREAAKLARKNETPAQRAERAAAIAAKATERAAKLQAVVDAAAKQ